MADEDYRRLAAACFCGQPVRPCEKRGRSTYCEGHSGARFRCEQCGKDCIRYLSGKNRRRGTGNRFCSQSCRSAAAEVVMEQAVAPRCSAYKAGYCLECSQPFGTRAISKVHCADCCRKVDAAKAREVAKLRHRTVASVTACGQCGVQFCRLYGVQGGMPYCSAECTKAAAALAYRAVRLKNKAKKRAVTVEKVDPYRVFEADGWRCYLCGTDTPRHLRGTLDTKAPELEHVVPFAQGGEHSYRNTRCACRECNALKGDRTPQQAFGVSV